MIQSLIYSLFLGLTLLFLSPQPSLRSPLQSPLKPEKKTSSFSSVRLLGQTPGEFALRRERVRRAAKGAFVFLVTPLHDEEGEHVRPRGDNALAYLTGLVEPGACLALMPSNDLSSVQEILFVEERPAYKLRYVGAKPGLEELALQTGIRRIEPLKNLWTVLAPSLQNAQKVEIFGSASLTPLFSENAGLIAKLKTIAPQLEIIGGAESLLAPLRRIKSPGEIANIRTAIKATLNAEKSAARRIRPSITELTIEGVILAAFRANGCTGEAFPSIVGAGSNSTVLHHYSDPRPMRSGETVVVDIGAEFNQYAADVTRTFPVNGKFTPRQRAIYELVRETQRLCERGFVLGESTINQLDRLARTYLRGSPLRWKDESGNSQTMDKAFWHGLGHLVGLDVHDVGDSGREPLLPGMVFTIEPGLYLPNENFGIRIEDDYLVTEKGLEKMSRALSSDLKEIEAMMRPGRVSHRTRKRKM